jgi:ribosomal protein S18 acetylase RimI-like enzyme
MRIERVAAASDELVEAFERLIPQLTRSAPPPSREELADLVRREGTELLVALDEDAIVGALTLVVYRLPTGLRAMIHDVVVDESTRSRGVGEALTREALRYAVDAGARSVELTSRSDREAANRLYVRLGFELRTTNAYVWRPGTLEPGSHSEPGS